MAVQAHVGSFTINTSTGSQTVTGLTDAAGASFTPSVIIFFGVSRTAAGGGTAYNTSVGVWAPNAATTQSIVDGIAGVDNASPTTKDVYQATDRAFGIISASATPAVVTGFTGTSVASGEFTINVTEATGGALIIPFLALGGNITADIVAGHAVPGATGNEAISFSGVGQITGALFIAYAAAASPSAPTRTNNNFMVGAADKYGNQWVTIARDKDNVLTSVARRGQRTDRCVWTLSDAGTFNDASIVSMGVNTLTVNWQTVGRPADDIEIVAFGECDVRVGAYNERTSTGTDTITTGHLSRSMAILLASFGRTSTTANSAGCEKMIGAASETSKQASIWYASEDAVAAAAQDLNQALSTSNIVNMWTNPTPTKVDEGAVNAMGADGSVGINMTTVSATAKQICFASFADPSPTSAIGHLASSTILGATYV